MVTAPFYWIFRYGGRDVLAAPADGTRVRRLAVRSIPAATSRSRIFRGVLEGIVATRADRFLARRHFNPVPRFVGFDWRAFQVRLGEVLGRDAFETAVVQPPQGQRNRFYVHLFSKGGERFAFAKVSVDEKNDGQLRSEAEALAALPRLGLESFRYPRLLATGVFQARQFLVLESLPLASRPASPSWTPEIERVRGEIAGAPRPVDALQHCSWWPDFSSREKSFGPIREAVLRDAGVGATVCRAHGDYVNWNFHEAGRVRWLFDWESFSPDAPPLTDPLRFFLGLHTRAATTRPARVARLLHEEYGCRAPERQREIFRALAFLHARGVTTATAVANAWKAACGEP